MHGYIFFDQGKIIITKKQRGALVILNFMCINCRKGKAVTPSYCKAPRPSDPVKWFNWHHINLIWPHDFQLTPFFVIIILLRSTKNTETMKNSSLLFINFVRLGGGWWTVIIHCDLRNLKFEISDNSNRKWKKIFVPFLSSVVQ